MIIEINKRSRSIQQSLIKLSEQARFKVSEITGFSHGKMIELRICAEISDNDLDVLYKAFNDIVRRCIKW